MEGKVRSGPSGNKSFRSCNPKTGRVAAADSSQHVMVSVYKSAVIKLQNTVCIVKYQPYFTLYCYNLLMHIPTPFS